MKQYTTAPNNYTTASIFPSLASNFAPPSSKIPAEVVSKPFVHQIPRCKRITSSVKPHRSSRKSNLDDGFQAQSQVPYLSYNDNNLQTSQLILFAKSGEFLSVKFIIPPYQSLKELDNFGSIDDQSRLVSFKSKRTNNIMRIDSKLFKVNLDKEFQSNQGDLNKKEESILKDEEPMGQSSKKRNGFYPVDSIFNDDIVTFNGKNNQKKVLDITNTRIRYNRKFLLSFVEKFSFTSQQRKRIRSVEEEDMQPAMKRSRTLAYCFNTTATYGEDFGFELQNMAFDPGDGNKLLDASSKKRNRSSFELNSTVPKRRRQNYLVPKQMVKAADIKGNVNAHNSNGSISAFTLLNRAPWFVNENQSLELQAKVTPTEATSRENLVARQSCQGNKRKFVEDISSFESFTFQPPAKRLKVYKGAVAVTCLELQGKHAHISPMNTTTNIDTCFHYSCVSRFFNCCKDKILMVILLLSSFTTKDLLFRRCLIDIIKNILCDIDQEKLEFLFCSRRNISYFIWLHYHINLVLYLQHNKSRTQVNIQHELIYVISFLWSIWVDRKDYSPMKDSFDASNAFSKHHQRIKTSRKTFMKSVIGRTPHNYGKVATFIHSGLTTKSWM